MIIHGFTLAPLARRMGLSGGEQPGLLIVGGSPFSVALAQALGKAGVATLIADPNRQHLALARREGVDTFYGDILGEAAEHHVEFIAYPAILAASDNDAYNTLVATDLGPEFGRDAIWQLSRARDRSRHALPAQLGGRNLAGQPTFESANRRIAEGWQIRTTRLTDAYDFDAWRAERPRAEIILRVTKGQEIDFLEPEEQMRPVPGERIVAFLPPQDAPVPPDPTMTEEAAEVADDAARRAS